jgi:4-hydroxy-tetrahydrodipicolinate synthase
MAEPMGYPKLATQYHQRLGTFACTRSRTIDFDIRERFWALDALPDKICRGRRASAQRSQRHAEQEHQAAQAIASKD